MRFTPEQLMLERSVEDFIARECPRESSRTYYDQEEYPYELFGKLAQAGMIGMFIPTEYGGSGLGPVETALMMETLVYGSITAGSLLMPTSLGTQLFMYGGTEEQKRTMLPRIAQGKARVSLGLSEQHSGSDAASLKLRAVKVGDHFVLDGSKMWTTGADVATHIMVAARTDTQAPKHKGISIFIVERESPGITVTPIETLGPKSQKTCQVFYEGVKVRAVDMLGGEQGLNRGWQMLLATLALERLEMAAMAVGLARRALDDAIEFVNDREAFGQRVGKFQAIQHMCAERATEIEAGRALMYRAAALMAAGEPHDKEVTMAKVFTTETATRTCLDGVQMLGGYGYSMEYDMQRFLRRALVGTIGGGTTQVLRSLIARQLGM